MNPINYQGSIYSPQGYAKMNRQLFFALVDAGVSIGLTPLDSENDGDGALSAHESKIIKLASTSSQRSLAKTHVYGHIPCVSMPGRGRRILYTMMETEKLSKNYFESFRNMNEIWTPTEWNKSMFEEGTSIPVNKLPISIGNHYFKDSGNRYFQGRKDSFNLFFNGSWTTRKGVKALVQAVTLLNGNAHLWILSRPKRKFGTHATKEINDDISRWGGNPDFFTVITDVIKESEMPSLYRSADALILPSLGEGWGMPATEAAACRIPVIATGYSGLMEFLDPDNAWLIAPDKMVTCRSTDLQKASSWFDPEGPTPFMSPENIAKVVYDCATNPDIAKEREENLFQKIQEYRVENVAKKAIILLDK